MANSGVCRVCLSVDVPMRAIGGSVLQIVYEKLTSIKLHTTDRRPLEACYMCYAQLSKSYKLMRTAQAAHRALTEILYKYNEASKKSLALIDREAIGLSRSLTFSGVEYYDTALPKKIEIKIETNLESHGDACDTEKCEDSRVEIELEPTPVEYANNDVEYQQSGVFTIEFEQSGLLAAAINDCNTSHADHCNSEQDPLSSSCNADVDTEINEDVANDGEPEDQKQVEENFKIRRNRRPQKKLRTKTKNLPPNAPGASATELQRSLHACTICQVHFTRTTSLRKHLLSNTHKRVVKALNNSTKQLQIEEKTFECNICHIRFKRRNDLPVHLKTHSGGNAYECNICQFLFATNQGLQQHLRWHKMGGAKPYQCDICQRRFTERSSLIKHVKNHSGEKPFQCNICQRRFNVQSNLKKHMRIHNDGKSHVCNICQHRFNEKGDLAKHFRSHTRETPYECNICKKRFSYNSNLRQHMRTHDPNGKRPYECNICHRRFYKKDNLKYHNSIHTGEKPFECNICKRRYIRRNDLTVHLRMHTGEQPFECEVCQQRFMKQRELKLHIREHTGEKPFECNVCQSKFVANSTLQKHIANYHSKTSSILLTDGRGVTLMPSILEVSGSVPGQVKIENDLT